MELKFKVPNIMEVHEYRLSDDEDKDGITSACLLAGYNSVLAHYLLLLNKSPPSKQEFYKIFSHVQVLSPELDPKTYQFKVLLSSDGQYDSDPKFKKELNEILLNAINYSLKRLPDRETLIELGRHLASGASTLTS